jgi:fatty acid desaturase
LREELRSAGVFEHREARSWGKLGLMAAALAAVLFGIASWGGVAAIALIPVAGVLCTSIAMCGHEGSHRSFSPSPRRNAFVLYVAFPLFSGLSSLYWHNKHDRLHHGHPNVEGMDPDIKPFPFVSSLGDHQRCSPSERWFQRNFQRYAFWPMSILLAIGMRRSSVLYLGTYARTRGIDRAWLTEVACMVAHYTCWIIIPVIVWGPFAALLTYAAIWSIVGVCLALVFLPAHVGLPVVNDQHRDWLHQIETTRNLELPRVVSMFFIGLDYQTEHHLFPKIPHMNLPKAAAITRAWCARNQVPYLSEPYLHALGDAARFMSDAWTRAAISPADMREALRAAVVG